MKHNIDIEAIIYMSIHNLKEEKNKEYSIIECDYDIAYVFKNEDEFKKYFIDNGFENIDEGLLILCTMKKTKKGSIIALKELCDHTITVNGRDNFFFEYEDNSKLGKTRV